MIPVNTITKRSLPKALMASLLSTILLLSGCALDPGVEQESIPEQAATEAVAQVPTSAPPSVESAASTRFRPGIDALELAPIASGMQRPLFITHAGDGSGRMFFVEQRGIIRVYRNGELLPAPFLDITDRVNDGANEQGLLGLAFAPNYLESGHFFVNYTGVQGATTVARFSVSAADPNHADASSETLVLQIAQPASNHNGGMLAFGPDGYLYIGMGDGGAANDRFGNGQNPQSLLAKMLRIDVTSDPAVPYLIPDDNPWVGRTWNGEEVLDEVWAIGLRNPWRFSFDRATHALWIGDVGQNQFEEINVVSFEDAAGANYGWPIMEGLHCFQNGSACAQEGLTMPVSEYPRAFGCSVTGGYVYRGQDFPQLEGVYLYADYCSGIIWSISETAEGGWQVDEVLRSGLTISSFGEDEAGELYIAAFSGIIAKVTVAQ